MIHTTNPKKPSRFSPWRPSVASLTGALAAALAPQTADAALITVGGDGGVGSVTLESVGDRTDLGGLLLESIRYRGGDDGGRFLDFQAGQGKLHLAARSSVSTVGDRFGIAWSFKSGQGGRPDDGALWDSSDNWLPGEFRVNGVNGGDLIYGWLHIRLGDNGDFNPTILSFTYDDEATGVTPFIKPIGGFSVPETDPVPEPSTLGLFGLGLGAAFVSRLRRRKKAERDG